VNILHILRCSQLVDFCLQLQAGFFNLIILTYKTNPTVMDKQVSLHCDNVKENVVICQAGKVWSAWVQSLWGCGSINNYNILHYTKFLKQHAWHKCYMALWLTMLNPWKKTQKTVIVDSHCFVWSLGLWLWWISEREWDQISGLGD